MLAGVTVFTGAVAMEPGDWLASVAVVGGFIAGLVGRMGIGGRLGSSGIGGSGGRLPTATQKRTSWV